MRARVLIITFLTIGLGFGCSSVNAPEAHIPEPISATDLCDAYADVICDGGLTCCSRAIGIPRADCLTAAAAVCTTSIGVLLDDPRSGYDAAEAGRQIAIGRRLVDRCDLSLNEWIWRRDGFLSMFGGSMAERGSCDATFPEDFAARPPVIDAPRFVSCGVDLACQPNLTLTRWNCLPLAGLGGRCIGGDCSLDLTCILISDTAAECMPRLADGSSCAAAVDCESYDCTCPSPSTCFCRANNTADQVYCGLAGR